MARTNKTVAGDQLAGRQGDPRRGVPNPEPSNPVFPQETRFSKDSPDQVPEDAGDVRRAEAVRARARAVEPEKPTEPSHQPKPGDRVIAVLRNGEHRPLDVIKILFDENSPDNPTVKGTLHSLGIEDDQPAPVTLGTFRYSNVDEDSTGKFTILTWHYPDDELQPKPEPVTFVITDAEDKEVWRGVALNEDDALGKAGIAAVDFPNFAVTALEE